MHSVARIYIQNFYSSGKRFAGLSKKLIQDNKFKEVAGEVIAVTTGVRCYLEPMQSVLPSHLEGEAAGEKFLHV